MSDPCTHLIQPELLLGLLQHCSEHVPEAGTSDACICEVPRAVLVQPRRTHYLCAMHRCLWQPPAAL